MSIMKRIALNHTVLLADDIKFSIHYSDGMDKAAKYKS